MQLFDLTQPGGPVGLSKPHKIGVFPDSLESLGLRCCVECVVWRCGGMWSGAVGLSKFRTFNNQNMDYLSSTVRV